MSDPQLGTVVIGGSQAGLAVGYYLKQHGLPFVILDENDRIGDAWRKRWDSLRLFTPGRYDGLPGMRGWNGPRRVECHFVHRIRTPLRLDRSPLRTHNASPFTIGASSSPVQVSTSSGSSSSTR